MVYMITLIKWYMRYDHISYRVLVLCTAAKFSLDLAKIK